MSDAQINDPILYCKFHIHCIRRRTIANNNDICFNALELLRLSSRLDIERTGEMDLGVVDSALPLVTRLSPLMQNVSLAGVLMTILLTQIVFWGLIHLFGEYVV